MKIVLLLVATISLPDRGRLINISSFCQVLTSREYYILATLINFSANLMATLSRRIFINFRFKKIIVRIGENVLLLC